MRILLSSKFPSVEIPLSKPRQLNETTPLIDRLKGHRLLGEWETALKLFQNAPPQSWRVGRWQSFHFEQLLLTLRAAHQPQYLFPIWEAMNKRPEVTLSRQTVSELIRLGLLMAPGEPGVASFIQDVMELSHIHQIQLPVRLYQMLRRRTLDESTWLDALQSLDVDTSDSSELIPEYRKLALRAPCIDSTLSVLHAAQTRDLFDGRLLSVLLQKVSEEKQWETAVMLFKLGTFRSGEYEAIQMLGEPTKLDEEQKDLQCSDASAQERHLFLCQVTSKLKRVRATAETYRAVLHAVGKSEVSHRLIDKVLMDMKSAQVPHTLFTISFLLGSLLHTRSEANRNLLWNSEMDAALWRDALEAFHAARERTPSSIPIPPRVYSEMLRICRLCNASEASTSLIMQMELTQAAEETKRLRDQILGNRLAFNRTPRGITEQVDKTQSPLKSSATMEQRRLHHNAKLVSELTRYTLERQRLRRQRK